jgi:hypothetical protein
MLEAAPLAGLACPECEKPIEEKLRKRRHEDEIVAAIRAFGDVPEGELEKIVDQSRERS